MRLGLAPRAAAPSPFLRGAPTVKCHCARAHRQPGIAIQRLIKWIEDVLADGPKLMLCYDTDVTFAGTSASRSIHQTRICLPCSPMMQVSKIYENHHVGFVISGEDRASHREGGSMVPQICDPSKGTEARRRTRNANDEIHGQLETVERELEPIALLYPPVSGTAKIWYLLNFHHHPRP